MRRPKISHAAGYQTKRMRVDVEVQRDINPTSGKPQFIACSSVSGTRSLYGRGVLHRGGKHGKPYRCDDGRNPRAAVARSLRKLAATVQARGGTFAGYSRTNRRNRRARRAAKRRY